MSKETSVKTSTKKRGPIIGAFIIALFLTLILYVCITASTNVKAMHQCIDGVIAELEQNYDIRPVDVGSYQEMTISKVMKFHVSQYEIPELGNLSIMHVNMGLMQMATIVITPQDKNMPLLSADYMYILSNRKAYLEFYDVVAEKDAFYNTLLEKLSSAIENYEHLENIETSPAWYEHLLTVTSYKGGKPANDTDLKNLLTDSVRVYLQHAKALPLLSDEERSQKLDITVAYTNGLIEKGGISTDVFKKELGDEATKEFFDNVFFGTSR